MSSALALFFSAAFLHLLILLPVLRLPHFAVLTWVTVVKTTIDKMAIRTREDFIMLVNALVSLLVVFEIED